MVTFRQTFNARRLMEKIKYLRKITINKMQDDSIAGKIISPIHTSEHEFKTPNLKTSRSHHCNHNFSIEKSMDDFIIFISKTREFRDENSTFLASSKNIE